MSSLAFAVSGGVTLPVPTDVLPAVAFVLSAGLVGMSIRNMFESIMSEDEGEAPVEDDGATTDGGGGLMAEADPDPDADDGEGDLGGLGGLDDDGEDLGGFEDDGAFGEMDEEGGGGSVDELEHRLEEMEAEVGSLSSTVNTVRNENEQISESVAEVEENVRKLLDIYEMVTRGVNPFADDVDAGMAGGMGDGGGFGLFDDDGGGTEDPIDEDIAEADAEGFFDEDLVEDDEELEADADVDDVLGDDGEEDFDDEFDEDFEDFDDAEEDFEDAGDGFDDAADDDDGGGGTSFQDLKEEYESGDAEWAEEEFEDAEAAADALEEADEDGEDDEEHEDEAATADAEAAADAADELADDELFDEVIEADDEPEDDESEAAAEVAADEAETTAAPEVDESETTAASEVDESDTASQPAETESEPAAAPTAAATSETETESAAADEPSKPYLSAVPAGFAAELLVVEWLEYLVGEAGVRETARAIDYYETIDWIDPAVAEELQDYLAGFEGEAGGTLTIDHHARSLRYIGQLNGGGADAVAMQRLAHGGGSDGIQR